MVIIHVPSGQYLLSSIIVKAVNMVIIHMVPSGLYLLCSIIG